MNTRGKPNINKTILLIDDERSWLDIMSHVLKERAFKVITAESGEEALKMLLKKKPDLILSDVRMPVMNGFELYEQVRALEQNIKRDKIPYVFMSSMDDYDAVHVAKQLGADGYVIKPFDIEDAKSTVSQLMTSFNDVNPIL